MRIEIIIKRKLSVVRFVPSRGPCFFWGNPYGSRDPGLNMEPMAGCFVCVYTTRNQLNNKNKNSPRKRSRNKLVTVLRFWYFFLFGKKCFRENLFKLLFWGSCFFLGFFVQNIIILIIKLCFQQLRKFSTSLKKTKKNSNRAPPGSHRFLLR